MGASYSATKLKVSLKSATARMTMATNKKNNAIRVDSRAIATLLQSHKDESARIKVEGLLHARNLISVMETLQLMCDLLATRIAIVTSSQAVPADLEESIATLVYCSVRVEVDELTVIAQQLGAKYGEKEMRQHVNNDSGRVNPRIVDKLRIVPPDFAVVICEMEKIAAEWKVDWKPDLSQLQSGMRSDNPERLGSIAGGPASSGVEYHPDDVHALPTVGRGGAGAGSERKEPDQEEKKAGELPTGGTAAGVEHQEEVGSFTPSTLSSIMQRPPQPHPAPHFVPQHTGARPVPSPASSLPSLPHPSSQSFQPFAASPASAPFSTYPGTLNVIVLQARDLPQPTNPATRTTVRITEPSTSILWQSAPALPATAPHHGQPPLLHFPHGQHLPLAITSAGTLIVVEGLHVTDGQPDEVMGGLSIEAEQLKRSAEGTWYTIFSSHTHQPRGQVLLASQYLPLSAAYSAASHRTAAPPGGAQAAAGGGPGEAAGVDPIYHAPHGSSFGAAVGEGGGLPPAYDGTMSGGVVRLSGEGEAGGKDEEFMSRFNSLR